VWGVRVEWPGESTAPVKTLRAVCTAQATGGLQLLDLIAYPASGEELPASGEEAHCARSISCCWYSLPLRETGAGTGFAKPGSGSKARLERQARS
jgi:hypothetical protein